MHVCTKCTACGYSSSRADAQGIINSSVYACCLSARSQSTWSNELPIWYIYPWMSATQLCYSSSSLITHFSSITFHRFYNPTIPAHTWKITQAALTSISLLTVQNSQKCFLYRTVQYVFDLVPQLLCKLNLKIKLIFFICLIADSWIHTNNICSFWLKYCFFSSLGDILHQMKELMCWPILTWC